MQATFTAELPYESRNEVAYREMKPRFIAITPAQHAVINIDVPQAVTTTLGALPEILALRPEFEKNLSTFDHDVLDNLENATRALSHAHALYRAGYAPKAEVTLLAAELTVIRDRLFSCAMLLASFGLMNGEALRNCKINTGYQAVAYDVMTLVSEFKGHWSAVAGKSPVTETELAEASRKAEELIDALGLREQGPAVTAERSEMRQKAFTLFIQYYEKVRRAVHYVRAEQGDADEIAPSLYAGRNAKKAKDVVESSESPSVTPAPMVSTSDANSIAFPIGAPFAT